MLGGGVDAATLVAALGAGPRAVEPDSRIAVLRLFTRFAN